MLLETTTVSPLISALSAQNHLPSAPQRAKPSSCAAGERRISLGETLHIDEQENTVEFKAQIIINTNTPLSESGLTSPGLNPEI